MSELMNLLARQMERSTAGSKETAREVMRLCGQISAERALFCGDDLFIPQLIGESTGASVTAAFHEDFRVESAVSAGLNACMAGIYEIPAMDGGWDFVWYNGGAEPDGVTRRLEQLHESLRHGACAVYRTLCWLIDPSPDTKCYMERRFGRPEPLDRVVREAKECGFDVSDFYISPKTDWIDGIYHPITELIRQYEGEDEESSGIGEINKEIYMFNLHSEEYSYVYYILRCK